LVVKSFSDISFASIPPADLVSNLRGLCFQWFFAWAVGADLEIGDGYCSRVREKVKPGRISSELQGWL